jgi:hypothetical protein
MKKITYISDLSFNYRISFFSFALNTLQVNRLIFLFICIVDDSWIQYTLYSLKNSSCLRHPPYHKSYKHTSLFLDLLSSFPFAFYWLPPISSVFHLIIFFSSLSFSFALRLISSSLFFSYFLFNESFSFI